MGGIVGSDCQDQWVMVVTCPEDDNEYSSSDDPCDDPNSGEVPINEGIGSEICLKFIPFQQIPHDDEEDSWTAGLLNVHVSAFHTETGEQVQAFWGSWCLTYGTGAVNVNDEYAPSRIFKEAWKSSTSEIEIWLNQQEQNPGNVLFSKKFISIFESNLTLLAGGPIFLSTGICDGTVLTTWLKYC